VDQRTGKITWLSSVRGSGILASIGGASLRFTCADGAGAASALTAGQVVAYEVIDDVVVVCALADPAGE
jgi:hypothetical protein